MTSCRLNTSTGNCKYSSALSSNTQKKTGYTSAYTSYRVPSVNTILPAYCIPVRYISFLGHNNY